MLLECIFYQFYMAVNSAHDRIDYEDRPCRAPNSIRRNNKKSPFLLTNTGKTIFERAF